MLFSESFLDAREDIWGTQPNHLFGRELAAETLNKAAFEQRVNQDHRYLINYTRVNIKRLFWQPVEHNADVCEMVDESANEVYDMEDRTGNA